MNDLAVILASRVPVVVVETHEETRFLDLLRDLSRGAFGGEARPLFCWTVTDGLRRLDRDLGSQQHNADPAQVLKHIRALEGPGVYVLLDFHPYLQDPVNLRLLKDIAAGSRDGRRTVILVSHALQLPADLERIAARFELQLPDTSERRMLVGGVIEEWNRAHPGSLQADPKALELLINNLSGLQRAEVQRLARTAAADGVISHSDLPEVMKAKYALLNRDGVLSFEYDTAGFAELGGLERVKLWLEQRRRVLQSAQAPAGIDPPKGLLLIGVQGCGKSLAARVAAGVFAVPLLRLDIGSVYDKYHGESERRLRESLRQAELMAPCVLWIDEIEKGLATSDADGGTSQRVLATFLTWMAEKTAPVFVVATANDVSRLPAELVRKGRFDELFFVDLPGFAARKKIIEIQLKKRRLDAKSFDIDKMAQTTEGYSGAELEQGVVAALYAAHAGGQLPGTGHMLAEFLRTRPLSVVMAERVQSLRDWARDRCVAADPAESVAK